MLSSGNREDDAKKELRRKLAFEIIFARKVLSFLNRVSNENKRLYSKSGELVDVYKYKPALQDLLYKEYNKIGNTFGRTLQRQLKIKDPNLKENILRDIRSRNQDRAVDISDQLLKTTDKHIKTIYAKEIEENEKNTAIRDDNKNRSTLIAETETQNTAEDSKLVEAGAVVLVARAIKKEWNAILDGKTREDHANADGQVRNIGEPFTVGGYQMMRPGDTSLGAPIGEVARCRCSVVFVTS